MDRIGHKHFAPVAVFGGSWLKANCALCKIHLRHSEIEQFRDAPSIGAPALHQRAEPKLCSVDQLAVRIRRERCSP
jgi:hypothetical protein